MPRIRTRIFGTATYEEKSDLENALLEHLKSLNVLIWATVCHGRRGFIHIE